MDFALSDEQRQLRDEVRKFAENEIIPAATEHDRSESYPREIVESAAEMGLVGAHIPFEYGGAGYETLDIAVIIEELFAADPGIGLCIDSASFGSESILEFGTHEQKSEYVEPVAKGEKIMGAAISEPHSGSDISSISTRAERDGDEWVINGNKMWITNGSVGDYFVILCRTDETTGSRHDGFSQVIVEADRPNFESEKITGKMGVRASDTAELILDGVRVPEENLVGTEGNGFYQQMAFFDETRTQVAAQGVGIAKGATERAIAYAQEREQFGRSIAEFQSINHQLADSLTNAEAARALTYKSAWSVDHADGQLTALASMAKEFSSRIAVEAADTAVQVHGGAGYVDDFDVERFYRDAKITQIYEGTSEIQKEVIAREHIK